ncbi:MAG: HAD family hydrolase [Candidatus Kapabacteria bacterium]|nr:HAD family hydrolase [Candidatus Kapabacteria bacterium]
MKRALFLDRDGIINKRIIGGYVRSPLEFELLSDVLPILVSARQKGYLLILITNQQGVGKGLMTTSDLDAVHEAMQSLLDRHGARLDAIYACTDLAASNSPRRKPAPGMLLEAIAEHNLDAEQCWFLGDSITDAQAGKAAGVRTALVGEFSTNDADISTPNLAQMQRTLSTVLRY